MAKKTKWPRAPDPRGGHWGARGFDPSYAMPYKIKIQAVTVNDPLFFKLVDGIILEPFAVHDYQIVYWDTEPDPLAARSFLTVDLYNYFQGPYGITVNFYWECQILTVVAYSASTQHIYPPGGFIPEYLTPSPYFPELLDFPGNLYLTAMPWDTTSGWIH